MKFINPLPVTVGSTLLVIPLSQAAPLPSGANSWTTLYATLDESAHAGTALVNPYAAGNHFETVPGYRGQGVRLQRKYGGVIYDGRNLSGAAGAIRLWFKAPEGGNMFRDGREYWLMTAERDCPAQRGSASEMAKWPGYNLLLYKTTRDELLFGLNNTASHWMMDLEQGVELPPDPVPLNVTLPVRDLDPGAWHEVVVSWDFARGEFWLRLNETLATGQLPAGSRPGDFASLLLGNHPNTYSRRQNFFEGSLDEILVSGRSLPEWTAPGAPTEAKRDNGAVTPWPRSTAKYFQAEPLKTYESQLRTQLDLMAAQRNGSGGWAFSYHYPSGMHFFGSDFRVPYSHTFFNNSKDSTSTLTALRCGILGEALGESAYTQVARDVAERVLQAQQPEGWWPATWKVSPEGLVPDQTRHVYIEDHIQTGAITLLFYMHRVSGEQRYRDAALRGAEFLLKAQNPNGSWSHHYSRERQAGESGYTKDIHAGELNDHSTTAPMQVLLVAYRLTGERKYLDAYRRAADWIATAFIDSGAVGWAQQYDQQNKPITARHFEPAAVEMMASAIASSELINAYRLTGEARYLEPVHRWVAWLKAKGPEYPVYFDIASGRPIVSNNYKVYFVDDPQQVAEFEKAATQTGMSYQIVKRDWVQIKFYERLLQTVEREKPMPLQRPVPTREQLQAESKARTGTLSTYAAAFDNETGSYTPLKNVPPGTLVNVGGVRILTVGLTLARERALQGDIPLEAPILRLPFLLDETDPITIVKGPVSAVQPTMNLYARLTP